MRFANVSPLPSLTVRLLVRCLATLLFTAAVLVALQYVSANVYPKPGADHLLSEESRAVEDGLAFDEQGKPTGLRLRDSWAWLFDTMPTDATYRVLDADGNVLFAPGGVGRPIAAAGQSFDPSRRGAFETTLGGVSLHVLTVSINRSGTASSIQVAGSARLARLAQWGVGQRFLGPTVLNALLSLIFFTIVIVLTLRSGLKPLRDASRAAESIAPNNLTGRVATRGMPSELMPLINAFNLALGRLEAGFKVQQRFLATAAHELKTPLSLIRGQIELDGLQNKEALLQDVDFMARQVQQLLHLTEVSEPNNFSFVLTDRAAAATDAARYLQRLAERHNVRIEFDACQGIPSIPADRGAFFILLKNLIENAIVHSPPHGSVKISVDASTLLIEDQGKGLDKEVLHKLFDPFWRGKGREHEGAGLGLVICRHIADAHGWRLTASNGEVGARFILAFNAASQLPPRRFAALGA